MNFYLKLREVYTNPSYPIKQEVLGILGYTKANFARVSVIYLIVLRDLLLWLASYTFLWIIKKSRFTKNQIVKMLNEYLAGKSVQEW